MNETEVTYVRRRVIKHALIDGKQRSTFPEYGIWTGMLARCSNPNSKHFARYGGRGITVCPEWQEDFANFYRDMGDRPSKRHSIDRIENDGNYEPGNCRWATAYEQANNSTRGVKSNQWTQEELAALTRMWADYYSLDDIAAVVGRTVGTVRLRAHTMKLRRDTSLLRLSRKHPDLVTTLRQLGAAAFTAALTAKLGREKAHKRHVSERKSQETATIIAEVIARNCSRNEKIMALRLAGLNLSAIGELFNITRERVRQLQLVNFRDPTEEGRKVSATRPQNRNKHIDRMIRAWNRASIEARQHFLDAANADPRAKMPVLLKSAKSGFKHRAVAA